MTTVRVDCPDCASVSITDKDIVLRICKDDPYGDVLAFARAYSFRCPQCEKRMARECSPRIYDMLVDVGVRVQVWSLPKELFEQKLGESITADDVIEFSLLLREWDGSVV